MAQSQRIRSRGTFFSLTITGTITAISGIFLAAVTLQEYFSASVIQDYFYLLIFLTHIVAGVLLTIPLLLLLGRHALPAIRSGNNSAALMGGALYLCSALLLISGLLITRFDFLPAISVQARTAGYWTHIATTLALIPLYIVHRRQGRRHFDLRGALLTLFAPVLLVGAVATGYAAYMAHPLHTPISGKPLAPSMAKTATGKNIAPEKLMLEQYCRDCHLETHEGWQNSVHRFSSFNNPAYRFSVMELRDNLAKAGESPEKSRFCAGCHDPLPLFSGRFDDPDFDLSAGDIASAGITCSACHAIESVDSLRGNGDYTIADPTLYPFTFSEQPVLKYINHQLIKAKPALHKKTYMKPFMHEAEFCSTCHKVFLPQEINGYKWLRGQNHYDAFLLSGVSGHGVTSFYYPPRAVESCQECHMRPESAKEDFGAIRIGDQVAVHDHRFAAANTGLMHMLGKPESWNDPRREMLNGALRVDLFGLRRDGEVDGELVAPLGEQATIQAGESYLMETVLRTLKVGHLFTQGTADSNQVWVEFSVRHNGELLAINGGRDEIGRVDPWSHFINAYLLDGKGNRIDRRNGQDIHVALYNHQIPPGAADVVHYRLDIPANLTGSLEITARLLYRKFDTRYLQYIYGEEFQRNDLPTVEIASDRITLNIGDDVHSEVTEDHPPIWQRWNDYGIGQLRKPRRHGLRQAEEAFTQVEAIGRAEGALNLARVYLEEGRLDEAADALKRAQQHPAPTYPWSIAWFGGLVNKQQGALDEAIENFTALVETRFDDARSRGFDFSKDYRLLNELGQTLFERAKQERGPQRQTQRDALLQQAIGWFEKALAIDEENATAHYNLALIYGRMGETEKADHHRALHEKYKLDDNIRERIAT